MRAPLFYAQMLAHCDRLRTLDEHAALIMANFGLPPEERSPLRQGLSGLVERRLLQDEQSVYAALGHESPVGDVDPPPLRTLCVRTCERPNDLAKRLASLSRHVRDTTLARILVLDDARRTSLRPPALPTPRRASTSLLDGCLIWVA